MSWSIISILAMLCMVVATYCTIGSKNGNTSTLAITLLAIIAFIGIGCVLIATSIPNIPNLF